MKCYVNDPDRIPEAGEIVLLSAAASVQFSADRAILLRVTRVDKRPTYDGWIWLAGYQLDRRGNAVSKRDVFVQIEGIKYGSEHRQLQPVVVATRISPPAASTTTLSGPLR